jgi:nucleotide-binding universal stress UspA family protein
MFQTIIVPLDGSPLAAHALDYATQVADPGAHLILVAVVDIPVDDDFRASHERAVAEMVAHSRDALTHELAARAEPLQAKGFQVTTTIRTGDATEEILRHAADARANLIVMASQGAGGVSRWLLGSVTNRVMHATTIPLFVARAGGLDEPATIDGIVVPLDGSRFAESAIPGAETLAARLELPVQFVRVVRSQSVIGHTTLLTDIAMLRDLAEYERATAEEYLATVVARFAESEIAASAQVLVGNPPEQLADYLASRPRSLVMMTTHGATGAARWVFGSITEKLLAVMQNPALVFH